MSTPTREALRHLIIVFFYSGISGILPIMLAWLQNDASWVILIPVINSVWYAVTRYLKERKLISKEHD